MLLVIVGLVIILRSRRPRGVKVIPKESSVPMQLNPLHSRAVNAYGGALDSAYVSSPRYEVPVAAQSGYEAPVTLNPFYGSRSALVPQPAASAAGASYSGLAGDHHTYYSSPDAKSDVYYASARHPSEQPYAGLQGGHEVYGSASAPEQPYAGLQGAHKVYSTSTGGGGSTYNSSPEAKSSEYYYSSFGESTL